MTKCIANKNQQRESIIRFISNCIFLAKYQIQIEPSNVYLKKNSESENLFVIKIDKWHDEVSKKHNAFNHWKKIIYCRRGRPAVTPKNGRFAESQFKISIKLKIIILEFERFMSKELFRPVLAQLSVFESDELS